MKTDHSKIRSFFVFRNSARTRSFSDWKTPNLCRSESPERAFQTILYRACGTNSQTRQYQFTLCEVIHPCVIGNTVAFAPKYRRQIIYGKIKQDIGQMLRKLCEYKGVEIIEAEACKDHIHMLVSIPPKYSVSQIMGYL